MISAGEVPEANHRSTMTPRLISFLVATITVAGVTFGCGGRGDDDGDADSDADADVDRDSNVESEEDADVAALCPEGYVTGRGHVFPLDAPDAVAERDLLCLEGDGTLRGYFVAGVGSSLEGTSGYEAAHSPIHSFLYTAGEPRFDEVQAYYVTTSMIAWVMAHLDDPVALEPSVDVLRGDEVLLDYGRAEVESRQWCSLMTMGMQRVTAPAVNVDVLAHELGHHIVMSLNSAIENSMLHEGLADYLAASFTNDPVLESSEWPTFDRSLEEERIAPDDIITREEYCQLLYDALHADSLETIYPGLLDALVFCLGGTAEEREAPAHHYAGVIVASALWQIRGRVGEEVLHPMLFQVLHDNDVNETGLLMDLLVSADAARYGGVHQAIIVDAFTTRGINVDLGFDFRDMGYSTCP